ncbi:hypothetical protein [Rhizohabitans arisaemae]|uniref:hypothetical protein n=1 Tax=Rhizohabitans arisaemae TaxID=2720610 RepID=UPI0024B16B37|nr:hypothetical protein [Rhizohabitans arisaemae]
MMTRSRVQSVLLVILSVVVFTSGAAEANGPRWKLVEGADIGHASALADVTATGPRDVWAVGYGCSSADRAGCPAAERWDGTRWQAVTLPRGGATRIEAVSAAGPDDVWLAGNGSTTWAAHWNGSGWTAYQPFGASAEHSVNDVVAFEGRPWFTTGVRDRALIVTWTAGGGFAVEYDSPGYLESITAYPPTGELWAVGTNGTRPLVVHGTGGGTTWAESPTPAHRSDFLAEVLQVGKDDVWAVGNEGLTPSAQRPLALHYDGRAWKRVPVPIAKGRLSGLAVDASGILWASGVDFSRGKQVLFLQYKKGKWVPSYGPEIPLRAQRAHDPQTVTRTALVRVPGAKDLWAVAAAGGGDYEQHFILRRR